MKAIKILLSIVVILAIIGVGLYYFGTNMASDRLVDEVSNQLENSGEMDEIKQAIESDPELMAFVEDGKNVDESKLPFTTKEEATRVLINKFGINGLMEIQEKVQDGTISRAELMQDAESKLTEEEILALKVITYKELYAQ
ncbi:hypothetical protein [Bacillus sp. CECT 9360]|uniref:hypothetical protein n=1 Tax=Bacillus sp. CECT 9360 TaxID=2845821 RepID=UPI001E5D6138|nr:hypothetical protein [Bacillus sp. CECT 9360]CAH0346073.1 hypothetical protein BCI9360_02389 [Bacillus sp. CECT 9360]